MEKKNPTKINLKGKKKGSCKLVVHVKKKNGSRGLHLKTQSVYVN